MKRRLLYLTATMVVAPFMAQAQLANVECDDSTRLTHMLEDVLGAERRAFGLRDPETVLEIWIHPRTDAWTIVQNYANGTSCIVAMGENWEALPAGPA